MILIQLNSATKNLKIVKVFKLTNLVDLEVDVPICIVIILRKGIRRLLMIKKSHTNLERPLGKELTNTKTLHNIFKKIS